MTRRRRLHVHLHRGCACDRRCGAAGRRRSSPSARPGRSRPIRRRMPWPSPPTVAPRRCAAQHHRRAALRARDEGGARRRGGGTGLARRRADPGRPEHRAGPVWRVFRDKPGPDGKLQARVHASRGEPDAAAGGRRLHRQRRVRPCPPDAQDHGRRASSPMQERFVLNAGGLRLTPAAGQRRGGQREGRQLRHLLRRARPVRAAHEGDERGAARPRHAAQRRHLQRRRHLRRCQCDCPRGRDGGGRQAHRGDARRHAAAKVTFKLVARAGGDAIADTQWNVANAQGETVKESVGALPTHILAPGSLHGQRPQRRRGVPAHVRGAGRAGRPGRGAAPLRRGGPAGAAPSWGGGRCEGAMRAPLLHTAGTRHSLRESQEAPTAPTPEETSHAQQPDRGAAHRRRASAPRSTTSTSARSSTTAPSATSARRCSTTA